VNNEIGSLTSFVGLFAGDLKNGLGGSGSQGQTVILRVVSCSILMICGWAGGGERSTEGRWGTRTVLLHNGQNLDDDLGSGPDQDLPLTPSLGVDDVVKTIVEDGNSDHFDELFGRGGQIKAARCSQ
jgi:hypothetical protein